MFSFWSCTKYCLRVPNLAGNKLGQCGRYVDLKLREPKLSNVGRDTALTEEIIHYTDPHLVPFRSHVAIKKIVTGGNHSVAMDESGIL